MGCSQILTIGIQDLEVDLLLFRLVDMRFNGMFSNPHYRYTRSRSGSVLIRLVDMSFNGMFSNPHYRYTRPRSGSAFNKIGGHEFQWDVLKSSLQV